MATNEKINERIKKLSEENKAAIEQRNNIVQQIQNLQQQDQQLLTAIISRNGAILEMTELVAEEQKNIKQ